MTHATSNQAARDAAHPQPSAGRRRFLKAAAAAGASAALPLLSGRASAASHLSGRHMVHTTWGGVYRDAQVAAYCDPFSAATGAEVIQGGPHERRQIERHAEKRQTHLGCGRCRRCIVGGRFAQRVF
ncbi:MAG: twin-arginine translocation signal domain-containing protein [Gammaproteobacteria bacterium]|nr:twin-arginine translocation signal domain-containing protein [Gammaproteobacteria bacterium]